MTTEKENKVAADAENGVPGTELASIPLWRKLVPFALRSRSVMVGRERLLQYRKKLAFVMITLDISENSRNEVMNSFDCPVYQLLSMQEVAELFGFKGTKVIGFLRSPLSNKIASAWKDCKLK